jgi:hypothetical protein
MYLLNDRMTQPLVLGYLLHSFQIQDEGSPARGQRFIYAGSLIGLLILSTLVRRPLQYNMQLMGMRLRISASSLVYSKVTGDARYI